MGSPGWIGVGALALLGCSPPRAESPNPNPPRPNPPRPNPPRPNPPPAVPAPCACGNEPCPATLDEAVARLRGFCSEPGFVLSRSVGCGRIQLHAGYATEGSQYLFDERDGRFLAAARWFDVAISACPSYPAGRALPECPGARECTLCGVYQGTPACSD